MRGRASAYFLTSINGPARRAARALDRDSPAREVSIVEHMALQQQAGEYALNEAELDFFEREGYLIIPRCMSATHCELVKADIDAQMQRRAATVGETRNSSPWIAETEHLGGLTVFPPIVERVAQLMATYKSGKSTFSLHHQHAARFDAGAGSADWHQVGAQRCAACPPRQPDPFACADLR